MFQFLYASQTQLQEKLDQLGMTLPPHVKIEYVDIKLEASRPMANRSLSRETPSKEALGLKFTGQEYLRVFKEVHLASLELSSAFVDANKTHEEFLKALRWSESSVEGTSPEIAEKNSREARKLFSWADNPNINEALNNLLYLKPSATEMHKHKAYSHLLSQKEIASSYDAIEFNYKELGMTKVELEQELKALNEFKTKVNEALVSAKDFNQTFPLSKVQETLRIRKNQVLFRRARVVLPVIAVGVGVAGLGACRSILVSNDNDEMEGVVKDNVNQAYNDEVNSKSSQIEGWSYWACEFGGRLKAGKIAFSPKDKKVADEFEQALLR